MYRLQNIYICMVCMYRLHNIYICMVCMWSKKKEEEERLCRKHSLTRWVLIAIHLTSKHYKKFMLLESGLLLRPKSVAITMSFWCSFHTKKEISMATWKCWCDHKVFNVQYVSHARLNVVCLEVNGNLNIQLLIIVFFKTTKKVLRGNLIIFKWSRINLVYLVSPTFWQSFNLSSAI